MNSGIPPELKMPHTEYVYEPFDLKSILDHEDGSEALVQQITSSAKRDLSVRRPSPSLLDSNATNELGTIRDFRRRALTDPTRGELWRAAAWITSNDERSHFIQLLEDDPRDAKQKWNQIGARERQLRRANASSAHKERRKWAVAAAAAQTRNEKLPTFRAAHEWLELLSAIMREADNDSDAADFIKCELHCKRYTWHLYPPES